MGFAVVDHDGHVQAPGDVELGTEAPLLVLPRGKISEVVKAHFPERHDLRLSGVLLDEIEHGQIDIAGIVRVNAEGGVNEGVPPGKLKRPAAFADADADGDYGIDPAVAGAPDHGVAVGVEFRKIKMGMRVDERHGSNSRIAILDS